MEHASVTKTYKATGRGLAGSRGCPDRAGRGLGTDPSDPEGPATGEGILGAGSSAWEGPATGEGILGAGSSA